LTVADRDQQRGRACSVLGRQTVDELFDFDAAGVRRLAADVAAVDADRAARRNDRDPARRSGGDSGDCEDRRAEERVRGQALARPFDRDQKRQRAKDGVLASAGFAA
jgi:hypothetical protein